MPKKISWSDLIRPKYRVHETVYLEALRVGESHVELKVEIYELADGQFSAGVFALEFFNLEEVFGTATLPKGVVPLYVLDEFYDTSSIKSATPSGALDLTRKLIHRKLSESGCQIEILLSQAISVPLSELVVFAPSR